MGYMLNMDGNRLPVDWKLSLEDTKKYLRLAKNVKDVENPCYSRAIGTVIVDPDANVIVSTGHNGPPMDCPPNDDPEYLRKVVWPQLTTEEKGVALGAFPRLDEAKDCDHFVNKYANCRVCPRKHINAPSGKRLDLCTCIHGETDAICRAKASGGRLLGSIMFCACAVPCIECTKLIINSRLSCVVGVDHGPVDYSPYSSRWLFEKSRVNLILAKEEWIWGN